MTTPAAAAKPTLQEVHQAAERIAPLARRTPVFTSQCLDALADASLFFKCENFQKTGSFKFRGACNAVFALPDDQAHRGVVTHSSGNHAAALALAARLAAGVECIEQSPPGKTVGAHIGFVVIVPTEDRGNQAAGQHWVASL